MPFLGAVAVFTVLALALIANPPMVEAEGDGRGARPIDAVWSVSQGISFFTDCDNGGVTTECGGAPGHWFADAIPVRICSQQFARPAHFTALQFRTYVSDAAKMWNTLEAAVGFEYSGDCTTGFRWEDNNDINEIGFDDGRNVVTGSAAAIARGSWFDIPFFGVPTDRRFVEFDVILDIKVPIPEVCTRSVIAHELGHVLGFGHSDEVAGLMFNSFDPDDLATCPTIATTIEQGQLQQLYGVNRAPKLSVAEKQVAVPGGKVTLLASASDPEGDPITYSWEQTGGTSVGLTAAGPQASFLAPNNVAASLQFTVTARDQFRHLDTATITVSLDASTGLPALLPSFASFRAGIGSRAGGSALAWTPVDGASSYRVCTSVPFSATPAACSAQASEVVGMDWDTVVGTVGSPDVRRTFTTGARETSLAACNAAGCTAQGVGPLIGGLRWPSWDMDYDYLAMAFDVPGSTLKFTIGGVTNIEGPARRFDIYVGSASNPLQKRIWSCGNVAVNGVCFGLLTPSDAGHLSYLTIVSSRPGTPTTEHQIRIR